MYKKTLVLKKPDIAWINAQAEILGFLVEFLNRVEWHYGDNRAPIKYPPEFSIVEIPDGTQTYRCIIETDFLEPEERIIFTANTPGGLIEGVKLRIMERFGRNFE